MTSFDALLPGRTVKVVSRAVIILYFKRSTNSWFTNIQNQ